MAFLGSVGKFIDKALHNPVVQTVFPVVAVANLASEAGISKVLGGLSSSQSHAVAPASNISYFAQPQGLAQPYYTQYQVTPGGSYLAQDVQPNSTYNSFGGVPSWGYSTPSPAYSIPQPQTYPAPSTSGNRSWEDLMLGAVTTAFL
jgi:hypothetical protein